ncbi:MAG: sugar phosphate isomerase/epimerase family protein [Planctomycetota bacterium]
MFKKSISYWSFPGGLENTADHAEVFAEAKRNGFEAVELCVDRKGVLTPRSTEKQVGRIRAAAEKAGVEIASVATGMYWTRSMSDPSARVRESIVEDTKRCLAIARWAGTDALLTIPASVDVFFNPKAKVVPYDVAYKRAKEGVRKLLPTAEKLKVAIAVENVWNKLFLSPLEVRDFIDGFRSPYVGAYFDVGNVVLTGYPEQWIEILGKRIKRIHLKDFKRAVATAAGFCDLGEGDVNWRAVTAALKKHYRQEYLTAEMMPPDETLLARTSEAMDKILGRR